MSFAEISRPSPNFTVTPAHEQLGVCFHHSAMDFDATITHMLRSENKVSYHVLIAPDGTRATLVADHHIAWHAGVSTFLGRACCNNFLLGAAFAGDTYITPITNAQLASAIEWLTLRWSRHDWTPAVMTDHRQIAPIRKNDLNPSEWTRLITTIHEKFPHT